MGVREGTVTFNHVRVFEMDKDGLVVRSEQFFDVKNGFTIVKRHVAINIFNTTVTSSEKSWNFIDNFQKLGNTRLDINIESVSIANTSMNSGCSGIQIFGGRSDYDAMKVEGSVRIHNVTISSLSDGCHCALCVLLVQELDGIRYYDQRQSLHCYHLTSVYGSLSKKRLVN